MGGEAGMIDIDLACWVTLFSILSFVFGFFDFSKKTILHSGGPFQPPPDDFFFSFHFTTCSLFSLFSFFFLFFLAPSGAS